MKFVILTTSLLSLAAAAAPTTPQDANAIAYISLLATQKIHYFPSPEQQLAPSSIGSTTIQILVGQSLNFPVDQPFAQQVELQRVTPGKDLQGVQVREGDERVVCKVMLKGSSSGIEVRANDKVKVEEGRGESVSGVYCEIR